METSENYSIQVINFIKNILIERFLVFHRWIHDYQDACIDKLERFLLGEENVGHLDLERLAQEGQNMRKVSRDTKDSSSSMSWGLFQTLAWAQVLAFLSFFQPVFKHKA